MLIQKFIFKEGRKKIKDKGEKKKRSGNSSEEDSAGAGRSKKKQKKGAGAAGSTSGNTGSAATTAGEGTVIHHFIFTFINYFTKQMILSIFNINCFAL